MSQRQLFVFFQFNGDNSSFCNYHCPYCYAKIKDYKHHWNNKIDEWQQAFEHLNRDIYFVFSYGEAMGSHGFTECLNMIGEHPTWTLNIVTNLSYNPEPLIESRLGQERRVYVTASWHPLGTGNKNKAWIIFKKHLLLLKDADIPVHVQYLWYKPQIKLFPKYFEWLDKNDFRVTLRRYAHTNQSLFRRLLRRVFPEVYAKPELEKYTETEEACLRLFNSSIVNKYNLELEPTYGMQCSAGKDMILVEHDGTVKLCADCYGVTYCLGNIFDPNYKLNTKTITCPIYVCGGCYGMLHLTDDDNRPPDQLWNDTFISQAQNIKQSSPIHYPNREKIQQCLKSLR